MIGYPREIFSALNRIWNWVCDNARASLDKLPFIKRPRPKLTIVVSPPPLPEQQQRPRQIVEMSANRKERRRLERLRRKHDKFITPKGPTPIAVSRPKKDVTAVKPERVEVIVDDKDNNDLIIDEHHADRGGEDVLYEQAELYGEFNFRDTILEQLECYFVYLHRMKKKDHDSYHFYKQVGATVLPYIATGSYNRQREEDKLEQEKHNEEQLTLPSWFNQQRPSFGCYVYGADPETEKYETETKLPNSKMEVWVPKFLYFIKYSCPPPEMQPMSGGDIYKMTVWWDRPFDSKRKRKYGVPQEFGIFVSRDGKQVIALRHLDTKMITIRCKRKFKTFEIPQRAWQIPGEFEEWAKLHGLDVQRFLSNLFIRTIKTHEQSQYSMIRVAATKDDTTAIFSVNVRRTSYFFQDRDIHLNEAGGRKRVFHMVRAHNRKTKSGEIDIKFHFRGEREFTWAGYQVAITVPSRDHFMMDEFDVGVEDEFWAKPGVKYVYQGELGKKLVDRMKQHVGARR